MYCLWFCGMQLSFLFFIFFYCLYDILGVAPPQIGKWYRYTFPLFHFKDASIMCGTSELSSNVAVVESLFCTLLLHTFTHPGFLYKWNIEMKQIRCLISWFVGLLLQDSVNEVHNIIIYSFFCILIGSLSTATLGKYCKLF